MIGNLIKLGGYALLAREAADLIATARDYQERELQKSNLKHAVTGSLIGITVGVGIGVLFAPRTGKETRELISSTASEKMQVLQDEFNERKKQVNEIISTGREKLCAELEAAEEASE